ncbi:hypothetical protein BG74_01690 [Sodalis-like endosymbiont of Proechinophthirus fluctus]|nr:hypothetical protein BG74_01690 [Sodalis-like endosymbiont of Proechinophthirus fluctus]
MRRASTKPNAELRSLPARALDQQVLADKIGDGRRLSPIITLARALMALSLCSSATPPQPALPQSLRP